MSLIGELFQLKDRWSSAKRSEKAIYLFLLFLVASLFILTLIVVTNQVSLIFSGRNIIEEIHFLAGNAMAFLSNFDVILILSVLILLAILAIVFVYIIDKLMEERTKAKIYHKKVLTEFEGFIKFINGETKYVSGELKINYGQESFCHLIKHLSVKQSDEDIKEKLGEVYSALSKY